jgi:hypothetical protein
MIERDYEELKSQLGVSQYEGCKWRGFHDTPLYASPPRSNNLPYPKASGRAGLGPMQLPLAALKSGGESAKSG